MKFESNRITRRSFNRMVGAMAAAVAMPVLAQSAANVNRIIVPWPAGGIVDAIARIVGDQLGKRLREPVLTINQPGASGMIALEALRAAPPDGRTFMIAPFAVPVLNPLVMPAPGPVLGKDYLPVGAIARYAFAVAVGENHPSKNLAELLAWLKTHPDKALFGTAALGNLPHFIGLALAKQQGMVWTPVGYKGAPQMKLDLISGRLATAISADADFLAEHRQGTLRVIATTTRERSRTLPQVQTFVESGVNFQASGWHGVFVPGGTPTASIQTLNKHLLEVLALPEVHARIVELGFEPGSGTPEDLAALIASDVSMWQPVVKASGFSASN